MEDGAGLAIQKSQILTPSSTLGVRKDTITAGMVELGRHATFRPSWAKALAGSIPVSRITQSKRSNTMELVEKTARPRALDSNGWYVRIHEYIGWKYDKKNFCPFFWKTVLALTVLPGTITYRTCIYLLYKLGHAVGYALSSIANASIIAAEALHFEKAIVLIDNSLQWFDELAVRKQASNLEHKWGHHPGYAYEAGRRANLSQKYQKQYLPVYQALKDVDPEYHLCDDGTAIWKTSIGEDAQAWLEEDMKVAESKRKASIGMVFLCLIMLAGSFCLSYYGNGETLILSIVFGAKMLGLAVGLIATFLGVTIGSPIIYAYWTTVVLQKYCPAIDWDTSNPNSEENNEQN